jgi:Fe2+ transport system protein FeoA
LSELGVGEWAVVKRVEGALAIRRRLETMGFVPGVQVYVSRCAPMGDPRAYELLGYCLSLRQEEAELIMVERLNVISLNVAPAGRLRVVAISGGRGIRHKLKELGIAEGTVLNREDNGQNGPVTVTVQGRRLQFGRGMAARIMVALEANEQQAAD